MPFVIAAIREALGPEYRPPKPGLTYLHVRGLLWGIEGCLDANSNRRVNEAGVREAINEFDRLERDAPVRSKLRRMYSNLKGALWLAAECVGVESAVSIPLDDWLRQHDQSQRQLVGASKAGNDTTKKLRALRSRERGWALAHAGTRGSINERAGRLATRFLDDCRANKVHPDMASFLERLQKWRARRKGGQTDRKYVQRRFRDLLTEQGARSDRQGA